MGAKTRRAFSDSITHLIFKNGSPSTLKKAMAKNVFIVSLLWISSCKRKGERVPEKEFMIDKSQGLVVTTGKKRRKSMEPSKVRALVMNGSLSSSSEEGSTQEEHESKRKKLSISNWEARDFNSTEKVVKRRSMRPNFDEDPLSAVPAEIKLKTPRLSLPISIETSTNKSSPSETIIPIHAPSLEKKEQIKARFSIGKNTTEEEIPTPLARVILPVSSPLKRRRRLTGNLTRVHSTDTLQPIKYTIVLTSVSTTVRKQCEEAIKKFNLFELASEVTECTTHVLVGANRRTKSVTLGLLRGVWMLSPEWLVQSGQKNVMVSEKEYELSDWYPRTEYRKQTSLLNPTHSIHVVSSSSGVELIEDMIKMAGGSVVKVKSLADVIISDTPIETEKIVVTDGWLFDMIEQWQFLPTNKYLLGKKNIDST
ncbi:hypothetical protein BD770DRAFT_215258 [Pilaira anomala]|nr:hypothetical protein BD770DRAFT_215258 [Pilaira anomala]